MMDLVMAWFQGQPASAIYMPVAIIAAAIAVMPMTAAMFMRRPSVAARNATAALATVFMAATIFGTLSVLNSFTDEMKECKEVRGTITIPGNKRNVSVELCRQRMIGTDRWTDWYQTRVFYNVPA
jgi:hypothetical protein